MAVIASHLFRDQPYSAEILLVSCSTSDQHKEATHARTQRDLKDIKTLLALFDEKNSFTDDLQLRNIVTGVTAEDTVNAEDAKSVGTGIVNEMVGKCVAEHSFKKKNQVQ